MTGQLAVWIPNVTPVVRFQKVRLPWCMHSTFSLSHKPGITFQGYPVVCAKGNLPAGHPVTPAFRPVLESEQRIILMSFYQPLPSFAAKLTPPHSTPDFGYLADIHGCNRQYHIRVWLVANPRQ